MTSICGVKGKCMGQPVWKPLMKVSLQKYELLTNFDFLVLHGVQGTSKAGKAGFIGCDKWSRKEEFEHKYHVIEEGVDEMVLRQMLDNGGIMKTDVTLHKECTLVLHPQSHKLMCREY